MEAKPRDGRRLALIGAGAAAVLAAGLAATFGAGVLGTGGPEEALSAAGCTLRTYPDQGRSHIASLDAKVEYKTFPPTSGSHFGQPAIFDAYPEPINQKMGVHNLEHGGVLIQYGANVSGAEVDELLGFYRDDPNGLLIAPLPRLGGRIALTAWTHLALCPSFDEGAVGAFLEEYRFKGPERLPPEALAPGR